MALKIQVSNSLLELTKQLCLDLKAEKKSVFQPNYIVTQTAGMDSWLKLQMAENLGIAANIRFLKPNDLIHQVYRILGGKFQQSLSPQNQSWLIYHLLGDKDFINRFKTIAAYYGTGLEDQDLKRLALAEKVSDLFDQYQMYRPELIRSWNQESLTGLEQEEWQMYLWLNARAAADGGLPDKTFTADFILNSIKDPVNQEKLKNSMPSLRMAGLSVLTDFHMELFAEMANHIDVTFYVLNPAPSIDWSVNNNEIKNPLLQSWAGVTRNFFTLLNRYHSTADLNIIGPVETPELTLLNKIKADIIHNRSNLERKLITEEELKDESIVISAGFTPVREVEALYNYLVHLVDHRKEQLSARDIVVMVSDIDTYAPYIRAVFQHAPHQFPFTIADESFAANDSIAGALLAIMDLSAENFKAEQVIQLLDSAFIRKRFQLTDVTLIRRVINQANFRFGMDGERTDDSIYVSWNHAYQRIMYGICMSGEEEYQTAEDGLFPLDLVEGNDALEMIRFGHFMEVLIAAIKERDNARTLAEWVTYVEPTLLNLVFDASNEEEESYTELLKQIERYNLLNEFLTDKVSFPLFKYSFQKGVGMVSRTGVFAQAGITFCSLIPMRSIPFKVVAMLGLNFDKFPRKENPLSFNLIEQDRRNGDRNVKANDKHLFLETLLAAEKYLYISYLGQGAIDNTQLPPSAMIDELLDYIQDKCLEVKDVVSLLITRHTLHGFSSKYTSGDSTFYSYLNREMPFDDAFKIVEKSVRFEGKEVSLDSLVNFLKNPFKGYFNKALSIYYRDEEVLLGETELFELDHLQKWQMKEVLLHLDDDNRENLRLKLMKTGGLPLKNMSSLSMANVEEQVAPVRGVFVKCIDNADKRVLPIDISFGGINLKGSLNHIYGRKMVMVSWSKNEGKYLLDAYIRYLAARACGYDLDLFFISAYEQKLYRSAELPSGTAKARLQELLDLFIKGHRSILTYYPGFDFKPQDIANLNFGDFKKRVNEKLNGFKYSIGDPYLMYKYNNGHFEYEYAFEDYKIYAQSLLLPLAELFPDYYQPTENESV